MRLGQRERRARTQNRHYFALPSPVLVTKLQRGALPLCVHSHLHLTTTVSEAKRRHSCFDAEILPTRGSGAAKFSCLWSKHAVFLTKIQHIKHPPRAGSSPWLGSMCRAGPRSLTGVAWHNWQATHPALRLLTGVVQRFHSVT